MTLNCSGVRLDNQKVFRAPGPRTKYFKRIFLAFNEPYILGQQMVYFLLNFSFNQSSTEAV